MAYQTLNALDVARQIRYKRVYDDDREASTSAYWDLENQIMFPLNDGFLTAREDYPTPQSQLKFDRTVSRIMVDGQQVIKMLSGEDKRKGASPAVIKKAEDDVERKSLEVMDHEGTRVLYCQTTMGTAFRLWYIELPNRFLQPLFGLNKRADKSAYVDIRTSHGQYHWHRLGSIIKDTTEYPFESFSIQEHLVAPPEWMRKIDEMQKRLDDEYYGTGEASVAPIQEPDGRKVHIHKEPHTVRSTKYWFRIQSGKEVNTVEGDWKKERDVAGSSYLRYKKDNQYWCRKWPS
ncbi:hypothetical protein FLAG1_11714 [Fusarium langsethiae]|uniref:Uncharacterized protein n=1 Tax=Fusarium langsethiae TaxID=179993 RepID=A0A0M9EMA4_FUSLA|nr:hypothetical protein FLAG1_11714 [Fusarium langsethiae]